MLPPSPLPALLTLRPNSHDHVTDPGEIAGGRGGGMMIVLDMQLSLRD